jgi:hypothetical protein
MKKSQKKMKVTLGDLVAALFEETKKVTKNRLEQNLLVYAALRDLLKGQKYTLRPVPVRVKHMQ